MPPPPVPKKKGRPAGARDKTPRKPVVRVKIEPLAPEPQKEHPVEIEEAPKKSEPQSKDHTPPKVRDIDPSPELDLEIKSKKSEDLACP